MNKFFIIFYQNQRFDGKPLKNHYSEVEAQDITEAKSIATGIYRIYQTVLDEQSFKRLPVKLKLFEAIKQRNPTT